MEKILMVILPTLFTVSVFAQTQKYSIEGHLQGIESNQVFLEQFRDNAFVPIDTANVVDGNFRFEGVVENGVGSAAIRVPRVRGYVTIFFESGKITIRGDVNKLYLSEVRGGANGEKLSKCYKNDVELNDQSMEYLERYHAMNRAKNRDSSRFYLKKHEEYLAKTEANKQEMINGKCAASLYYYRAKVMSKITDGKAVEHFLSDYGSEFENNNDFLLIKRHASTLMTIGTGSVIPDITLPQRDDTMFQLSSLRGKYVLIDFWASWCAPCRREAKAIATFYGNYSDCNFEIVGVSIDDDKSRWIKAMEEDGTVWKHVWDKGGNYKNRFAISSVPRMILISPEGEIIDNNITTEKLLETLKELFGK